MVVARKTPVAPVPSSSRPSSSQSAPKPTKSKSTPAPSVTSNGKIAAPTKKSKSPIKKKTKRSSSHSKLFLILLSAFTVYAVAICRTDFPRTSPVCHSLDLYRAHVLDPYVLPPIQTLVHHAEPYLEPIKPYASSAADFTRTHVVPRASAVIEFSIKQYHVHVAPRIYYYLVDQYWNGFVKPIYYQGVHPHIEPHTRPYRIYYSRFIVPGAKRFATNVHVNYVHLRPYAVYYLSEAQRHTINVYGTARPHVIEAYRRVHPHAVVVLEKAKIHALDLSGKIGDARREFVDPHILRIWEKVVEADVTPSPTATSFSESSYSTRSTPAPTQALAEEPTPSPSSTTVVPVVQTPEPVVVPEPVAEAEPEQEAKPEVTPPPSHEETPTSSPSLSSSPEPSSEPSSSEADILPSSAPVHVSPVPAAEHEAASAASVVAASLHVGAETVTEPEPEKSQSAEEVDDFLKDIGLSEEDETVPEPTVEEAVEKQTEATPLASESSSPESPEEKLEKTAKKRAEIVSRHERWQADLDALARTQTQGLRSSLSELRVAGVAELAQWGPGKNGVGAEVESEANKLLKGLEGYLRGVEEKIKKANGKQTKEQRDKDREMWSKVVEKVEIRFAEKVRDVQKEVHDWYLGFVQREMNELDSASDTVKAFAERAQGDLGLDYAWLDDVSYYDWQKYHDLMRTSENFTSQAQKIQAQVDPAGTNELVDALNDLEGDVDEIVEGFDVLVAGVRRRAESEDGVFARIVDEPKPEIPSEEKAEEPEVSILPIEPVKEKLLAEEIFVGRSKEEVEANLAGVPVEDVRAGREEL
ncbi:hypothetical protein C0991_008181 [Blastosporella zonata]|nr:hypothetical protein C0991_008181 [Blastosporella zonata]